ncbi:IucA/IucC family C-terminal-domain containing protein [Pigmentiphaga aceris]|nr:IucA/IucC family C-terminal-domain containing protein [Pigmentiphaga aceris]
MLGKRHSFLATGASLYAMSVYNRAFDLSPENTCVDVTHDGKLWRSHLRLRTLHTCAAPDDANARHAWRDTVIAQLFAQHLAPLWSSFCAVSRLAPRILWENMAVRVYSLYESRMPGDATPAQRARIDADFAYLVSEAPGTLFGLDHNPLARYFHSLTPTVDDEDGTRFRKTCCLYYKLPSGELCSTCPLLRKKG